MIRSFIGLGSNLDHPEQQLRTALLALKTLPLSHLQRISPVYRNPAIGPGEQPDYLNAVAEIHTDLPALDLLHALQAIETQQGRRRDIRWGARTLDLDLLLYGDTSIDTPELQVPHPRLTQRNFVLYPLHNIAPDLKMPDGSSLRVHLDSCPDAGLTRLAVSMLE